MDVGLARDPGRPDRRVTVAGALAAIRRPHLDGGDCLPLRPPPARRARAAAGGGGAVPVGGHPSVRVGPTAPRSVPAGPVALSASASAQRP